MVLEEAPRVEDAVPAGQGVGLKELKGQNEPPGQTTGPPEAHAKPAGQGTHDSWRILLLLTSERSTVSPQVATE